MSNIIRATMEAPTVFIGERHQDTMAEQNAEQRLRKFYPFVSFVTMPDGSKMIPIQEINNVHNFIEEERVASAKTGYDEGYQAGLRDGQVDARDTLKKFEGAIRDAFTQREKLLLESKQNVLQLVLKVASKVTCDAVSLDPEVTLNMISRVIDQLVDRSALKVRVAPDFLPVIEQQIDRFLVGSTSIKEIKFEADPRVRFGGCFIETPTGDIDARLESQFEVIEEALFSTEDDS